MPTAEQPWVPEESAIFAREWLTELARTKLAPVEYHEPKGNVFLDISVEGERFQGAVFGDSLMIGHRGEGACAIGVAAINFVAMPNGGPKTWAICKYRSQWHMSIGLSGSGRRRLALEFGIPIVPLLGAGIIHVPEDDSFFYNSSAFSALQKWARAHTRKVLSLQGDSYLYLWPLSAIAGRHMEVNSENIALSRDKAALRQLLAQSVTTAATPR